MREDFLQYVWRFRKFNSSGFVTSQGEPLEIIDPGMPNNGAGPDFFNARLKIGGQLWAGNVEVHVKSSDWYLHGHENNLVYSNVILHVVWEDDVAVFRPDNSVLPTFVLKEVVHQQALYNYKKLFGSSQKFINCENSLASVSAIVVTGWLERLYIERLEEKSIFILRELDAANGDWEATLFQMLMKSFGLNVNGDAFYSLAKMIDFSVLRKLSNDPFAVEAMFFGLAGLLEEEPLDSYQARLKEQYQYLKHKFQWTQTNPVSLSFFRLRPYNFPTIRLSQLARLYCMHPALFSEIITATSIDTLHTLFQGGVSPYWKEHYTFGKKSPEREKKLSKSFIDLLLINTIIPITFCYARKLGKENEETFLTLMRQLQPEANNLVARYHSCGIAPAASALESQALVQLYQTYCSKNACLQCAIGERLLRQPLADSAPGRLT